MGSAATAAYSSVVFDGLFRVRVSEVLFQLRQVGYLYFEKEAFYRTVTRGGAREEDHADMAQQATLEPFVPLRFGFSDAEPGLTATRRLRGRASRSSKPEDSREEAGLDNSG
jgi:hypothetical protein